MKDYSDRLIKEFENVRAVHCGDLGWLTADPNLDQGRYFTCSIDHSQDTLEGKQMDYNVINVDNFEVQHFVSIDNKRDGIMAVFSNDNLPTCKFMHHEFEERDFDDELLDFNISYTLTCSKTGRWGDIENRDG